MNVLIITYRLPALGENEHHAQSAAVAPLFLKVPGLLGKVWLADRDPATYGGVYVFANRAALDGFLASEIVAALRAIPGIEDVAVRVFDAVEAPTRITQGAFGLYETAQAA